MDGRVEPERRSSASRSARAWSDTSSTEASGTFATRMPSRVAASTSTLSTPTPRRTSTRRQVEALERGSVEWLDRAGQDEVSTAPLVAISSCVHNGALRSSPPCGLDSPLLVADRPEPLGHDDDGPAPLSFAITTARSAVGPIEAAYEIQTRR